MAPSGAQKKTGQAAVRTLIYIPVIHTPADMGVFRELVQQLKLRKLGRKGWERNLDLIDQLWTEIEDTIDSLPLSYQRLRLYQDGLPVCGREVEIVSELAKAGSRNHQLLLHLKARGAEIMGTESSELLVEEYELIKRILALKDPVEAARVKAREKVLSNSLLQKRDRYIANRINATLSPGETGILFLGMLHSLGSRLRDDVRVVYPILRPFDFRQRRHGRGLRQSTDR